MEIGHEFMHERIEWDWGLGIDENGLGSDRIGSLLIGLLVMFLRFCGLGPHDGLCLCVCVCVTRDANADDLRAAKDTRHAQTCTFGGVF